MVVNLDYAERLPTLHLPLEIVSLHQLCGAGVTSSCCSGAGSHPEEGSYHESLSEERKEGEFCVGGNQLTPVTLALFQKEDEQRRRRKSKAQFFEMIQEIRR